MAIACVSLTTALSRAKLPRRCARQPDEFRWQGPAPSNPAKRDAFLQADTRSAGIVATIKLVRSRAYIVGVNVCYCCHRYSSVGACRPY
jgi:hypothetical protein